MKDNNVHHPSHYADGGIECIDAMLAAFGADKVSAFCQLNAFKYLWRAGKKANNTSVQDLKKARWYIDKEIELMSDEQVRNEGI